MPPLPAQSCPFSLRDPAGHGNGWRAEPNRTSLHCSPAWGWWELLRAVTDRCSAANQVAGAEPAVGARLMGQPLPVPTRPIANKKSHPFGVAFSGEQDCFTWHRPIFSGGYPPNIVGAASFHSRVRDGSEWFHCAMDTRIAQPLSGSAVALACRGLRSQVEP